MIENILLKTPNLFADCFIKVTKEYIKFDEKGYLEGTPTIIGEIIIKSINGFIPSLVGSVLEGLLKSTDNELKKISQNLSKLIQEPLKTGFDQLKIAMAINPSNESEFGYQQLRYRSALENFDKAANLCQNEEKPYLDLLRGITTLKISGGQKEAIIRMNSFKEYALSHIISNNENILTLENEIKNIIKQANEIKFNIPRAGGGLIGMSASENYMKRQSLLNAAKIKQNKLDFLNLNSGNFKRVIESIEVTLEVIK